MEEILALQQHREGDVCVIHPIGEVDMQTMRPLRELVRRLPDEGVRFLVMDLRDVNFLDSAGMSILFGAKKRLSMERGECYVVTTEDGFVAKTLHTIAIEKVMPHLHDVDVALADVQQRKEGRASLVDEAAQKAREDWAIENAEESGAEAGVMAVAPDSIQACEDDAWPPVSQQV